MKRQIATLALASSLALGITTDTQAQSPTPIRPNEPNPADIFTRDECLSDAEKVVIINKYGQISVTFSFEHPLYENNKFEIVLLEGTQLDELQIRESLYQLLTTYNTYAPQKYKRPFDKQYSSDSRTVIIISPNVSTISREQGFCDSEIVVPQSVIIDAPRFLPTTDTAALSSLAHLSLTLLEMAMEREQITDPRETTLERDRHERHLRVIFSRTIWMLMLRNIDGQQHFIPHGPLSNDLENIYDVLGERSYNGLLVPTYMATVTAETYGTLLGIYATHISINGHEIDIDQLVEQIDNAKQTSNLTNPVSFITQVFLGIGLRDGSDYIDVTTTDLTAFVFGLNNSDWGRAIKLPLVDERGAAFILSRESEFAGSILLPRGQEYVGYDGFGRQVYFTRGDISFDYNGIFIFRRK